MSTKKVSPRLPSGFNELLPPQQLVFEWLKREISRTYESLGYSPLETSNLELTEVLLAKGGGETEKQVYSFIKGKNNLTLRYDLTVPLARYVAQNYSQLNFPFKRYQMQKVWRAEKAQKGRSREFYQCDVDILGNISILADAETVFAVYHALVNITVPKFTISLNNRKFVKDILKSLNLSDYSLEILKIIDKLDKLGPKITLEQLDYITKDPKKSLKLLKIFSINGTIEDLFPLIEDFSLQKSEGLLELKNLYNYLLLLGVKSDSLKINLSIVRGLDYYTSSVFETFIDGVEQYGSIASGGRYDNLTSYYSNQNIPGVGVSIGLTRLFNILVELNKLPKVSSVLNKVLVCYFSADTTDYAVNILAQLRKQNINSAIYLANNLSLNKQLDLANKSKVPFVVIIGEDEVKNNVVTLKNMESGEQKSLKIEDAIKHLKI